MCAEYVALLQTVERWVMSVSVCEADAMASYVRSGVTVRVRNVAHECETGSSCCGIQHEM